MPRSASAMRSFKASPRNRLAAPQATKRFSVTIVKSDYQAVGSTIPTDRLGGGALGPSISVCSGSLFWREMPQRR